MTVTGMLLKPMARSSSSALGSVRMFLSVNATFFCERNSFTLWQALQPVPLYTITCWGMIGLLPSAFWRTLIPPGAPDADSRPRTPDTLAHPGRTLKPIAWKCQSKANASFSLRAFIVAKLTASANVTFLAACSS